MSNKTVVKTEVSEKEVKKYGVRKLNLLDLRTIAKIFRELGITKEYFVKQVAEVVDGFFAVGNSAKAKAAIVSDKEKAKDSNLAIPDEKSMSKLFEAILPLLDTILMLFIDLDIFWEFLASILQVEYDDLANFSLGELKYIAVEILEESDLIDFLSSTQQTQETSSK